MTENFMQPSFKTMRVDDNNRHRFIDYCKTYRYEHDESDLHDEDLEAYDPNDWPAFMLLDDHSDALYGVICLKTLPYMEHQLRARLVIWHLATQAEGPLASVLPQVNQWVLMGYRLLWEAALPLFSEVDHIMGFLPETKAEACACVETLGFHLDRFVFLLTRPDLPVIDEPLPEGYSCVAVSSETELEEWVSIRNEAFKVVKGNETPMTMERARPMLEDPNLLNGGMLLLRHGVRPIGALRMIRETEDDHNYAFVAPIAIHPDYQGKNWGRWLLRHGLTLGKMQDCPYGMLSVNADNERAASLYLQEGFEKTLVMKCYHYAIQK